MLKNIILVFLGGGFGSILRFTIGHYVKSDLPLATLLVNLLGSLLIGVLFGVFDRQILSHAMLLLLATGFCGGFTTFSTFSLENLEMIEKGNFTQFLCYGLGSLLLGIFMVFAGFKLAKFI